MSNETRSEVGRYAFVYTGGEGVSVTVLRIGPLEANEALVMISGIDHPWDGKIFKHTVTRYFNNGKIEYSRPYKEGSYVTLRGTRFGSGDGYEVWIPRPYDCGISLRYDEAQSRVVQPEHFLTQFLEQIGEEESIEE